MFRLAFQHARADAEGVDEHQVRGVALLGHDLREAAERGAQLLAPVIALAVGAGDAFGCHRGDHVIRGEEALFLAREQLVEAGERDARERDDLLDRDLLVAVLGDGGDHRALQPGALVEGDLLGAHSCDAARQHPVERLAGGGADALHRRASIPPQTRTAKRDRARRSRRPLT
jgi:hypothetical protein